MRYRYRGRGRPRVRPKERDLGTRELQAKRANFETEELLDRYHRLGVINDKQYWCGNHFRWLYTIRFGIPHPRVVDPAAVSGIGYYQHDELWAKQLNEKYRRAEVALADEQLSMLLCIAVYGTDAAGQQELQNMLNALDILVKLWC